VQKFFLSLTHTRTHTRSFESQCEVRGETDTEQTSSLSPVEKSAFTCRSNFELQKGDVTHFICRLGHELRFMRFHYSGPVTRSGSPLPLCVYHLAILISVSFRALELEKE